MPALPAVNGQFQHAGSSTLHRAVATFADNGQLIIRNTQSDTILTEATTADYRFGSVIPGLAVELQLRDGAIFVPDDPRFRWPQLSGTAKTAARLESHKLSILAAVILSPLLLWWIIVDLMPMLASALDGSSGKVSGTSGFSANRVILPPASAPHAG